MASTEAPTLSLRARTAADVMTADPMTLRQETTVPEAVKALLDRGITAAPVVDDRGQPVGVLSRSDLVQYQRERHESGEQLDGSAATPSHLPDYYQWADVEVDESDQARGFEVEESITTTVAEIMTPAVFFVEIDTPIETVIANLLERKIHRLFVVNRGSLVGVISALDILRFLEPDGAAR